MALEILEIRRETCPAARLIGKKYENSVNWDEWWENHWFEKLEGVPSLSFNGDAYVGAVHIVNGVPERWIGMLFPQGTEPPAGFEAIDMEPLEYAVCYLRDKEGSSDFYIMETHNRCLAALQAMGFRRKENSWCLERYNCPRFTTPDNEGTVILDYGIAIEG